MSKASIEMRSADMTEEMQREALQVTLLAFHMHSKGSDIAKYIKKEFDRKYQPTWQCIVGDDFSSHLTHETNCYICFCVNDKKIVLFKTG